MITIYSDPISLYCAKLRILLRHKGLPYEELPPPGGYGSDEYRAIVPSGNLPAMVHDGFMLADSEAIAEYLNEAFPDVPMLPDDLHLRAKVREKGRLHDTRLEPAIRTIYPFVAYENQDAESIARTGAAISKSMASLDLLLSAKTLDPNQLWMCDCGFAVAFAWIKAFEQTVRPTVIWPEAVRAYDARLQGFDAVIDELAAYRPAMDSYLEKAKPPQA